jgi:methylmalonyl-CoA mutase cobalamin-binding domain/chain
VVRSTEFEALARDARAIIAGASSDVARAIRAAGLVVLVAGTDVHEHGKFLIEEVLRGIGAEIVDGGVSADPDDVAALAAARRPDVLAISTYNGVALDYARSLRHELDVRGLAPLLLFGGRLNQIPEGSNTSLPVDVAPELPAFGIRPCATASELVGALAEIARARHASSSAT